VKDRHGKTRYRFQRKGWKAAYIAAAPGSSEFHKRYAEILEGGPKDAASVSSPRKIEPKSIDDLLQRMKATPRWQRKAARTRHVQSQILKRFTDTVDKRGRRYGDRPVDKVTVGWLDAILAGMHQTPAAANVLRKVLSGLMDHACRLEWRESNPVKLTDAYPEGEGHHTWTDAEIEQYRERHKLGTMARLTLELALNTAARRCNVNKIERAHIEGGRIAVDHAKGNHDTSVPMLATTKAAIDALPAAPIRFLVTTVFGQPFTDAGLGNKVRQWCDEADLNHCSLHGLRKALSRQLAESGATDAEGQAITGHKKPETFAKYRAKANRSALADRAFYNLTAAADLQPTESD
jgi:integrase